MARLTSNRSGCSPESPEPPQPASAATPTISPAPAAASRTPLRRLLALPLDAGFGLDRGVGRLLMAAGTIPDHVGLGDALLARLRLDLGPGQLRLGKIVPASQVECLQCPFQRRP